MCQKFALAAIPRWCCTDDACAIDIAQYQPSTSVFNLDLDRRCVVKYKALLAQFIALAAFCDQSTQNISSSTVGWLGLVLVNLQLGLQAIGCVMDDQKFDPFGNHLIFKRCAHW